MKLEDEILQKEFKNPYHKASVNLIYTYNWFVAFQDKILKGYGVTLQQYNVLRILRGQHPNPATVKLIRERMLDKMSDASRIVEKLRLKGWADRSLCPKDRRNVDVTITGAGLDLLLKIDKQNVHVETFLSNLNREEIEQLNYLLDKWRG
jgi:DNA-binding MarR family transcriptional regulator